MQRALHSLIASYSPLKGLVQPYIALYGALDSLGTSVDCSDRSQGLCQQFGVVLNACGGGLVSFLGPYAVSVYSSLKSSIQLHVALQNGRIYVKQLIVAMCFSRQLRS